MAKVAIVYHSGYGHTAKVAQAVERGAASVEGADIKLISVEQVDEHWDDLNAADAIIFGAPTYMGSASAKFKEFADKTSKIWMNQGWKDKLAGGFTNSGAYSGDKQNTLVQMVVLAAQHSMLWISLGQLPGNNTSTGSPNDLNRVGSYTGLATQSNLDQGADVAPIESDLKTAEGYGRRVAELAARWAR